VGAVVAVVATIWLIVVPVSILAIAVVTVAAKFGAG